MSDEHPNLKFVRLTNGDDLVAEVVETEDEDGILYTLFHPLRVVYIDSESEGYTAIAFAYWVFRGLCDQQEFVIHAEDVMVVADLSEKMSKHYWEYLGNSQETTEKSRKDKIREAAELGYDELDFEKKVYH